MKVLSKVLGVILARLVLLLVGCWLLVRVFCPSSGINVPRRYLSHLPQDLLGAEKSFAPSLHRLPRPQHSPPAWHPTAMRESNTPRSLAIDRTSPSERL